MEGTHIKSVGTARDYQEPSPPGRIPATFSPPKSSMPAGSAPTNCSRSTVRTISRPTTRRAKSRITNTAAEEVKFGDRAGEGYTVAGKGGPI